MSDTIENVLILQGGGSLGAFGCGVLKALASSNIKIDIIAGTSIGGLNASIIAGSRETLFYYFGSIDAFLFRLFFISTATY